MTHERININLNPRKFSQFLLLIFCLLLIAHLSVVFLKYKIMPGSHLADRLDQFMDFNKEVNFPTYFNSMLLFLSAQTFLLIALCNLHTKFYYKTYWYILSFIFLFLSIDEYVGIHEWFGGWARQLGVNGTGILRFTWIVPYGIVVFLFGIYSVKFLLTLEKRFLRGYLICGTLYLLAAIGIESISGILYERNNNATSFEYILYYATIEESLEMLSLILLLNYNLKFLMADKASLKT